MYQSQGCARVVRRSWAPIVTALLLAEAVTLAPAADAQPPGTLCGNVENQAGISEPVIVLKGAVDCATAANVAAAYLGNPPTDSGTLMMATVHGWMCSAPLLPGRSHANSYLECDESDNGFKIGN